MSPSRGTSTTRSANVSRYALSKSSLKAASRCAKRNASSCNAATISSGVSGTASSWMPSLSSCSRRKRSALLSTSTGSLNALGAAAMPRREEKANPETKRSRRASGRNKPRPSRRWRFEFAQSEAKEATREGVATGRAVSAQAVIARVRPTNDPSGNSHAPLGGVAPVSLSEGVVEMFSWPTQR